MKIRLRRWLIALLILLLAAAATRWVMQRRAASNPSGQAAPTSSQLMSDTIELSAADLIAVDGDTNAVTSIPVANFLPVNWVGKMFEVNTVTHRLYTWSGDFMTPGKLVVVDANRSSGTFNTVIAEIPTDVKVDPVTLDIIEGALKSARYEMDTVLFRTASGTVGCFDDICPHRRSRLSSGTVVGERLQCQYHAWTFDTCGNGESPGTPKLTACAALAPPHPRSRWPPARYLGWSRACCWWPSLRWAASSTWATCSTRYRIYRQTD